MNKLSKSTWLLIGLLITLIALGTTLVLTMPEEYVDFFKEHRLSAFSERGFLTNENLVNEEGESGTYAFSRLHHFHPRPHVPVFLFIIAGIAIFIIIGVVHKKKMFYLMHGYRGNVSIEILEEQYAEGKISREELIRKRKIMEEKE